MQERPEGLQPPGCCLVSPWVLGCCSPCRAGLDLTFSPGCEASRGLVMLKLVVKNQGHKLLGSRGDWSSGLCVSALLSLRERGPLGGTSGDGKSLTRGRGRLMPQTRDSQNLRQARVLGTEMSNIFFLQGCARRVCSGDRPAPRLSARCSGCTIKVMPQTPPSCLILDCHSPVLGNSIPHLTLETGLGKSAAWELQPPSHCRARGSCVQTPAC